MERWCVVGGCCPFPQLHTFQRTIVQRQLPVVSVVSVLRRPVVLPLLYRQVQVFLGVGKCRRRRVSHYPRKSSVMRPVPTLKL